ncbi:hypothetical protein EPN29_13655 [bacterium]|nr:MAG: hypothetical protein EPN29_13655 [bacterium]
MPAMLTGTSWGGVSSGGRQYSVLVEDRRRRGGSFSNSSASDSYRTLERAVQSVAVEVDELTDARVRIDSSDETSG